MLKKRKKTIAVKKLINYNIKIPDKNKTIFTLENNGNSIFDYLILIAELEKIQKINICSFRISKRDLIFLEDLIFNKKIPVPELLLSDSIKTMVKGTYNYLLGNENFNTTYKNTHAKYCLIKTGKNYYSILSSGNFNPDGKIEQLRIVNNEEVYNFFKNN